MEVQMGENKQRRPGGVRLGAGRLMTYKEGADLPEKALKEELARLEALRARSETEYKREEAVIEAILFEILDSLGNYANLTTRESVHQELRREILRTLPTNKAKNEPVLATKDDDGDDEKPEMDSEVAKKIKAAKKLKGKRIRALHPTKIRPSYQEHIAKERKDRHVVNSTSYIRVLESNGLEQNPERINFWMGLLFPTNRLHSSTICGIKKRLQRYEYRLLMDANPKENGVNWFLSQSKVATKYPEIVRFPKPRDILPPIDFNGSLISRSTDTSSEGSLTHGRRKRRKAKFKKEPISAGEFVFGTRPRSRKSQVSDTIDEVQEAQYEDEDEEVEAVMALEEVTVDEGSIQVETVEEDTVTEAESASVPTKSILHLAVEEPDEVGAKRVKKVSINAPPEEEVETTNNGLISPSHDYQRRQSLDFSAGSEKRRKSVSMSKQDKERWTHIEELRADIMKTMRLKKEGRENEIDYELYFQKRKDLAMLLDDDESLEFSTDEDLKRSWEDLQHCKYIRGYEPPEMRLGTEKLSDFVFWKDEFNREESFVTRKKLKAEEAEADAEEEEMEAQLARRKSDFRRRSSIGLPLIEKPKSNEPSKKK